MCTSKPKVPPAPDLSKEKREEEAKAAAERARRAAVLSYGRSKLFNTRTGRVGVVDSAGTSVKETGSF